jgi:hypothetical protein
MPFSLFSGHEKAYLNPTHASWDGTRLLQPVENRLYLSGRWKSS